VDGVESAKQTQLAVLIGRRVAQNRHLNIHRSSFGKGNDERASRNAFNSAAAFPPNPGTCEICSALASRIRWTEPNFLSSAALRRSPILGNSSRILSEIRRRRSSAL